MSPRVLKLTQEVIDNSKDQRTGTGKGCDGTSNTGVIRKLDNTLKGIHNILHNGTWNQWLHGLAVPI